MRRLMAIVAIVAALSVVASVTMAAASNSGPKKLSWRSLVSSAAEPADGDNDGDKRLVLVERNATETLIDNAPEGDSQGDEIAFTGDLYWRGKKVGYDDGHVVLTLLVPRESVRFHATFTATVRGDEINAAGSVSFSETEANDFELSVTGGTGRYDDVGGEVTVVEGSQTKLVFDLEDLG
jgi:hypothetical protein